MASVCFCITAAVLVSWSTLSFTQSYQENDVYISKLDSRKWKGDDEYVKVSVSVNLRTAVREVDSRFVSITLDSSLVNYHWLHFDFRYDVSCFSCLMFLM